MEITIDCPQCKGPIAFGEELEMIRCPYCSSALQISGKSGLPCFMLPPRWSAAECRQRLKALLSTRQRARWQSHRLLLLYAPYWRCKGMVFHWLLGKRETHSPEEGRSWDDVKELKTKVLDFSFLAYKKPDLGLESLGIRTAALQLQLFHPGRLSTDDIVLPVEVSRPEAVKHSNAFLTFGFADSSLRPEVEDTQLVGEVYSIIYFPFWLLEVGGKNQRGLLVIDGLANRISRTVWGQDLSSFLAGKKQAAGGDFGTLTLFPCRCPVCGWDLPFSPQSKVHLCPTCTRAWAEENGSYREIDYRLAAAGRRCQEPLRYLPFWELETRIHTAQGVLETRTDLRTLVPGLPSAPGGQDQGSPIRFLIPAFRINSMPALCKLAGLFCLRPVEPGLRRRERPEKERFAGVLLAASEAEQMARVVLFSLVPRYYRRARPMLKEARFEPAAPQLIYYPFYQKGIYLREVNSDHGIQRGSIPLS